MMAKKPQKPIKEPKVVQEPPAEQPPVEEPYKPMGTHEPTPLERLEALEIKVAELDKVTMAHQKYHFGGVTGK